MPVNVYSRYLSTPVTLRYRTRISKVIGSDVRGVAPKSGITAGPAFPDFARAACSTASRPPSASSVPGPRSCASSRAAGPQGFAAALHDTVLPLVKSAWAARSQLPDLPRALRRSSAVYTQNLLSLTNSGTATSISASMRIPTPPRM